MVKKWDGAYLTVNGLNLGTDHLAVKFANADVVRVRLSTLTPNNVKKIRWGEARVESGGLHVVVPADPKDLVIPSDIIRRLTDSEFARHMAERAAKQARYIGARLRELRERRGLTQAKVASMAGIEPANLSRIENGHFDVSTSTLWKILAAMGYSARDLSPDRDTYGEGTKRRLWIDNTAYTLKPVTGNPAQFEVEGLALADLEDARMGAIRNAGTRAARLERPSGTVIAIELARLTLIGKVDRGGGGKRSRSLRLGAFSSLLRSRADRESPIPVLAYDMRGRVLTVLADARGTVFLDLAALGDTKE
ncbi:MAG: helix-turn-helix transcriptional regulator [Acidobacteria bacterium]|nr:helix-turn-helix transcriptional regulator [Acidobacteriota bacterium]